MYHPSSKNHVTLSRKPYKSIISLVLMVTITIEEISTPKNHCIFSFVMELPSQSVRYTESHRNRKDQLRNYRHLTEFHHCCSTHFSIICKSQTNVTIAT